MPELPDVAVFQQHADRFALRKKIEDVAVESARIVRGMAKKRLREALQGQQLLETRRHGKQLGLRMSSGDWLVLHFGMTGSLKYYKKDDDAPDYARVRIDFKNGHHLAFINPRQLGRVQLAEDWSEFIESKRLGPDSLDKSLDLDRFLEIADGRSGNLKGFLMNQSAIAGIGNVYADEILFQAKLDPAGKMKNLDDDGRRMLFKKMKYVLEKAVDRYAATQDFPRTWLLPHRKDGASCPKCDGTIKKCTVAGRTTYFCPSCQEKP